MRTALCFWLVVRIVVIYESFWLFWDAAEYHVRIMIGARAIHIMISACNGP